MIIRNNLDSKIIINKYRRNELINFDDPENYSLSGLAIKPHSAVTLDVNDDDILFISNYAKTLAIHIAAFAIMTDAANIDAEKANFTDQKEIVVDIWDNVSDLVRCQQNGVSNGISCKDTINILLKPKLHNLLILKLYNGFTYLILVLIIALAVSAAIFLGTFLL